MAKARDVARFFIALAADENEADRGDLMTNLRLQKLLYFAQGWHLARFGKPLFDEQIVAWKLGPVVQDVYFDYRRFKNQGIDDKTAPEPSAFTPDEFDLLMDVAREYAPYSTSGLVDMTHEPDTPWSHTRQSEAISIGDMRDYFSARHLNSFDEIIDDYPVEVLD